MCWLGDFTNITAEILKSRGCKVHRPHFSSIDDLKPVFDQGAKVVFSNRKPIISMGALVDSDTGALWRGHPYAKEIQIRARVDTFPPSEIYGPTSEADEQKITLIHELDHWFHELSGFKDGNLSSDHPIETEIDKHSFHILKNQPEILTAIIYQFSTRLNCSIVYEASTETPFYVFHRELVGQFIGNGLFGSPRFGDNAQIRLLELARTMSI